MPTAVDSTLAPLSPSPRVIRLALPLREACIAIGCKKTRLYELIAAGRLDARKAGSRTLITAASLQKYVAGLPKAAIGKGRPQIGRASRSGHTARQKSD